MDAVSEENRYEEASRILKAWGLSAAQSAQILENKEKLLAVLSIHDSLQVIYSAAPDRVFQWPTRPNGAFNNQSAVDIFLTGDIESIDKVRKYLKYHVYNA